MRASQLKETIKSLHPRQTTLCIEGAPGGGKTEIVGQTARELGVPFIAKHMPTMLVEDFGILFPSESHDKRLAYHLPEWFPQKGKDAENGILLFDDRNQAGSDLQKVLANVCQEHTLHGMSMPDGWQVISTGNRQTDKAGANRVLSHLRDREIVVELETDLADWTAWAMENGVHPDVISFLNFRPGLLHDFDPKKEVSPTPRSWVNGVSGILGHIPKELEFECFKGTIGDGATSEFIGFLGIRRNLPDVDKFILNPKKSVIKKDDAIMLYALTGAVAYKATLENAKNIFKIADMMPPEFSMLMMNIVFKRIQQYAELPEFTQWVCTHEATFEISGA